ncbi:MAG: lipid-A-disaccharide synthase [Schleiferiaceae bacterium]|nr:lipid-A-disaccharide synthase [Schleiferiaceae bacterium]MDR9441660.1 lipid-A-disaccharide synthase [Schleiferiaceae bacterium]
MKYYIVSGEASGDMHGALLIEQLRQKDASAQVRAWGGDRMEQAGATLVKHYRSLAFMGFVEVVRHLPTILANMRICKEDIAVFQPDVLVLIDYPGFNMRIARWAHKQGFRVVYYIAPQAWAWKTARVHKLRRSVHQLLVILPFEEAFFSQYHIPTTCVGHPLLDAIARRPTFSKEERLQAWQANAAQPVVALLPGSRQQEIATMLPLMLAAVNPQEQKIMVAMAPSQNRGFYQKIIGEQSITLLESSTYELLEVADAALVTSGTATLETALFGVPQVVCYRGSSLSYWIARRLVKVSYISLVNLVLDREVVTELIQHDLTPARLRRELDYCLSASGQKWFQAGYQQLRRELGGAGASQKAAQIIHQEASSA